MSFLDITYSRGTLRLERHKRIIRLNDQEFRLFVALHESGPDLLPNSHIDLLLWGKKAIEISNIDKRRRVVICHLRDSLAKLGVTIENLPRMGYRLVEGDLAVKRQQYKRGHYIQCGFRLPYVLKKALEETALQRGVTESELVRQILSGELCVADMPEPMIGGDRRSASFNSDLSP